MLFRSTKECLGTNVYKDIPDFLFFGHNDVTDFLEFHLKLYIYIYYFYYLFFFKILGPSFHLGVLNNGLIGLVEGPALGPTLYVLALRALDKEHTVHNNNVHNNHHKVPLVIQISILVSLYRRMREDTRICKTSTPHISSLGWRKLYKLEQGRVIHCREIRI